MLEVAYSFQTDISFNFAEDASLLNKFHWIYWVQDVEMCTDEIKKYPLHDNAHTLRIKIWRHQKFLKEDTYQLP